MNEELEFSDPMLIATNYTVVGTGCGGSTVNVVSQLDYNTFFPPSKRDVGLLLSSGKGIVHVNARTLKGPLHAISRPKKPLTTTKRKIRVPFVSVKDVVSGKALPRANMNNISVVVTDEPYIASGAIPIQGAPSQNYYGQNYSYMTAQDYFAGNGTMMHVTGHTTTTTTTTIPLLTGGPGLAEAKKNPAKLKKKARAGKDLFNTDPQMSSPTPPLGVVAFSGPFYNPSTTELIVSADGGTAYTMQGNNYGTYQGYYATTSNFATGTVLDWTGIFPPQCVSFFTPFPPIVVRFDWEAGVFAVGTIVSDTQRICVAVSSGEDPTSATWTVFQFNDAAFTYYDQGFSFSVWGDYYLVSWMDSVGAPFVGVIERVAMTPIPGMPRIAFVQVDSIVSFAGMVPPPVHVLHQGSSTRGPAFTGAPCGVMTLLLINSNSVYALTCSSVNFATNTISFSGFSLAISGGWDNGAASNCNIPGNPCIPNAVGGKYAYPDHIRTTYFYYGPGNGEYFAVAWTSGVGLTSQSRILWHEEADLGALIAGATATNVVPNSVVDSDPAFSYWGADMAYDCRKTLFMMYSSMQNTGSSVTLYQSYRLISDGFNGMIRSPAYTYVSNTYPATTGNIAWSIADVSLNYRKPRTWLGCGMGEMIWLCYPYILWNEQVFYSYTGTDACNVQSTCQQTITLGTFAQCSTSPPTPVPFACPNQVGTTFCGTIAEQFPYMFTFFGYPTGLNIFDIEDAPIPGRILAYAVSFDFATYNLFSLDSGAVEQSVFTVDTTGSGQWESTIDAPNTVRQMSVDCYGKVYIGMTAVSNAGNFKLTGVVRFNPDLTLDTAFGVNGYLLVGPLPPVNTLSDASSGVAVHPSGTYFICYGTTFSEGPPKQFAVKVLSDGTVLTGFGGGTSYGGAIVSDPVNAGTFLNYPNRIVFDDANNRIYIVGYTGGGPYFVTIAAIFQDTGLLDTSFGTGGYASIQDATSSGAVLHGSSLFISYSYFPPPTFDTYPYVAEFSSTGTIVQNVAISGIPRDTMTSFAAISSTEFVQATYDQAITTRYVNTCTFSPIVCTAQGSGSITNNANSGAVYSLRDQRVYFSGISGAESFWSCAV